MSFLKDLAIRKKIALAFTIGRDSNMEMLC